METYDNERFLVSAGDDEVVIVWDSKTWKRKQTLHANSGVNCLAITPCETYLIAGKYNGRVNIW